MENKDKQLLIKDLCARLPYEVKGLHRGEIQRLLIMDSFGSYQVNGYSAWFELNSVNFKPYLRSMSSMTEKEKEEHEMFFHSYSTSLDERKSVERIDWLNEHHFDYRGLISMGLALEAPEDMYKTE